MRSVNSFPKDVKNALWILSLGKKTLILQGRIGKIKFPRTLLIDAVIAQLVEH